MKIINGLLAVVVTTLLTACAGNPVSIGTRLNDGTPPKGVERTIKAEACGFQLLLFIPISINGRAERAYQELEEQAGGDFITDVQIQERWTYALVGTVYCTSLRAKAIQTKSN